MAQNAAKAVLKLDYTEPKVVLLSMLPFVEVEDIPGANLVMKSWMKVGTDLPQLVKYARDHKNDEDIKPVLDWFRDNLLPPKGEAKFDMTKEDLRAGAWIDALD